MLSLPKNIENICRLCLTESVDGSDMLPLFPVRGGNPYAPNTVVSKILLCTSIKVREWKIDIISPFFRGWGLGLGRSWGVYSILRIWATKPFL